MVCTSQTSSWTARGAKPASRPDKHVGWRAFRLPEDPRTALQDALLALLGRSSLVHA
jgi:hypothetical protein